MLNKSIQVETYKPKSRHGGMSSELMCGPQGFNVGHNYKDVYGNLTFLCWVERFQRQQERENKLILEYYMLDVEEGE